MMTSRIQLLLSGTTTLRFNIIVSASSTLFREIGSPYPEFAIIVAIGLRKPYAKPESGANLVPV
jgi:hypothetical protein